MIPKTGERVIPENFESEEEYLVYLRHLYAYEFAERKLPQNCLVLELGSGEGYGANILSKSNMVGEVIGLDVDLDSIKHASQKYASNKLRFQHYDGDNIPFGSCSFDVVISFQVIEHIPDDRRYVSEIYRVLKENGILILTTPNRAFRLKPGQKPWNRFHVREYSSQTLEDLLRHKFTNVETFCIRGNEEVQAIEIQRVRKILKLNALDPLYLRNLIPESFKPLVIRLLKTVTSKKVKNGKNFIAKYNAQPFYCTQNNFDSGLDLIAVCKKG